MTQLLMTLTDIGNCFIRIEALSNDVQLDFDGNTAIYGGENIFGGMLDKCSVDNNLLYPERWPVSANREIQ